MVGDQQTPALLLGGGGGGRKRRTSGVAARYLAAIDHAAAAAQPAVSPGARSHKSNRTDPTQACESSREEESSPFGGPRSLEHSWTTAATATTPESLDERRRRSFLPSNNGSNHRGGGARRSEPASNSTRQPAAPPHPRQRRSFPAAAAAAATATPARTTGLLFAHQQYHSATDDSTSTGGKNDNDDNSRDFSSPPPRVGGRRLRQYYPADHPLRRHLDDDDDDDDDYDDSTTDESSSLQSPTTTNTTTTTTSSRDVTVRAAEQQQPQQQPQPQQHAFTIAHSLEQGLERILSTTGFGACHPGSALFAEQQLRQQRELEREDRRTEQVRRLWLQRRAEQAWNHAAAASSGGGASGGTVVSSFHLRNSDGNNTKTAHAKTAAAAAAAANNNGIRHAQQNHTIQRSFAMEAARSDVTGATEIVTNRATDLALKRLQARRAALERHQQQQHAKQEQQPQQNNNRSNNASGAINDNNNNNTINRLLPPEASRAMAHSLLSLSSAETESVGVHVNASQQQQQQQQAKPVGKLGQHVERSSRANDPYFHQYGGGGGGDSQSKPSLSSSVGVEVDADHRQRNSRRKSDVSERTKSALHAVVGRAKQPRGGASQQPSVASVPEEGGEDDNDETGSSSGTGQEKAPLLQRNKNKSRRAAADRARILLPDLRESQPRKQEPPASASPSRNNKKPLGPVQRRTFRIGATSNSGRIAKLVQQRLRKSSSATANNRSEIFKSPKISKSALSHEEVSPDPIFCVKNSFSFSANSQSMPSQGESSHESFVSEDAMFMEKRPDGEDDEDSTTSLFSNVEESDLHHQSNQHQHPTNEKTQQQQKPAKAPSPPERANLRLPDLDQESTVFAGLEGKDRQEMQRIFPPAESTVFSGLDFDSSNNNHRNERDNVVPTARGGTSTVFGSVLESDVGAGEVNNKRAVHQDSSNFGSTVAMIKGRDNKVSDRAMSPFLEILEEHLGSNSAGPEEEMPRPSEAKRSGSLGDEQIVQPIKSHRSPQKLVPIVPLRPSPLTSPPTIQRATTTAHDQKVFPLPANEPVKHSAEPVPARPEPVLKDDKDFIIEKPTVVRPNLISAAETKEFSDTKALGAWRGRKDGNRTLATKLQQSCEESILSDPDEHSVSVKSIRSAFESVLDGSSQDDDDDDDSASVKSLRQNFEPPEPPVESGISRMRAMFESKKPPAPRRFETTNGNGNLKETFSKFEANSAVPARSWKPPHQGAARVVSPVVHSPKDATVGDDRRKDNEQSLNSSTKITSMSVADRIRALSASRAGFDNDASGRRKPDPPSFTPAKREPSGHVVGSECAPADHDAGTAKPARSGIPTRPLQQSSFSPGRVGKAPTADPRSLPRSVPMKVSEQSHSSDRFKKAPVAASKPRPGCESATMGDRKEEAMRPVEKEHDANILLNTAARTIPPKPKNLRHVAPKPKATATGGQSGPSRPSWMMHRDMILSKARARSQTHSEVHTPGKIENDVKEQSRVASANISQKGVGGNCDSNLPQNGDCSDERVSQPLSVHAETQKETPAIERSPASDDFVANEQNGVPSQSDIVKDDPVGPSDEDTSLRSRQEKTQNNATKLPAPQRSPQPTNRISDDLPPYRKPNIQQEQYSVSSHTVGPSDEDVSQRSTHERVRMGIHSLSSTRPLPQEANERPGDLTLSNESESLPHISMRCFDGETPVLATLEANDSGSSQEQNDHEMRHRTASDPVHSSYKTCEKESSQRQSHETIEMPATDSVRNGNESEAEMTCPKQMSTSSVQNSVPSFGGSEPTIRTDVDVTKGDPRTRESPIIIKPVPRKPYVQPVPIKPVVMKPVPLKPLAPPTSATIFKAGHDPRLAVRASSERDTNQNAGPGKSVGEQMVPRLSDEMLRPLGSNPAEEFDSDDTETESGFSDGVTLDVSIAEVSNLTNPTTLGSRTLSPRGNHHPSGGSSEDSERSRTKSVDLIDAEAKRSEASSSQTSEAAAPLIARALRKIPMSDEISTDSDFRAQLHSVKSRRSSGWDARNILDVNSEAPQSASESDVISDEKKEDEHGALDGSWDLEHMNSLFPTTPRTEKKVFDEEKTDESKNLFGTRNDWNPFPEPSSDPIPPDSSDSFFLDVEEHLNRVSRSKTPTRTNRTRRSPVETTLNSAPKEFSSAYAAPNRVSPENLVESTRRYLASRGRPGSEHGASVFSVRSAPAFKPPVSTTGVSDYATTSAVTTGGMNSGNSCGPKHAALLARIRALKEARLRRAAAIYGNSTGAFSSVSSFDELSQSTGNSSTKFGGSSFMASLEVD